MATGVDGDGETRRDVLLVPDPPSCHALGLFAMRIRRRGLRKFSALPMPLAVLLLRALMVESVRSEPSSTVFRRVLSSLWWLKCISTAVRGSKVLVSAGANIDTSSSTPESSSLPPLVMLARLGERLVNWLVMLVTLSLRIMECADVRMRCSFRARTVSPGNGRISRVHTSESSASSRALSPRDGASTGTRPLVASRDCERLIVTFVEDWISFSRLVFRRMTLHKGDFGLTVIAL